MKNTSLSIAFGDSLKAADNIKSLEEYCKILETIIIKNDCTTLKDLVTMMQNPIFALNMLPYCALFCSSLDEYMSLDSIKTESIYNIVDIRNKIKLFIDRYGRDKKNILDVDDNQDNIFKNMLVFPDLAKSNTYYNIGLYLDFEDHIIGNTQHFQYMLQEPHLAHAPTNENENFKLGHDIGVIVAFACNELQEHPVEICSGVSCKPIEFKYKDLNTNNNFSVFPEIENGKELTLRMLHILSSLNFIKYVFNKIVPANNWWAMRVKYVTLHYAIESIEKLLNKHAPKQKAVFVNQNSDILNSSFRNCMMHYSFFNDGICSLKPEYFDMQKPFFGLIESCFDGISYNELMENIDKEIDHLSNEIESILKIDLSGSKLLQ